MKLKTVAYYLLFILLLFSSMGCNEDPVSPGFSIEDEINSNRPFDHINIFDGVTYIYSNSTGKNFTNAYAKNGYLIIEIDGAENTIYNLSLAKEILTNKGFVGLLY